MLYQLSELEYAIMNSLADGEEPLSLLLTDLRGEPSPHPPAVILASLDGLMSKGLARCVRTPAGLTFTNPALTVLQDQLSHLFGHGEHDYWFELTEAGQSIWENWRQLHPR